MPHSRAMAAIQIKTLILTIRCVSDVTSHMWHASFSNKPANKKRTRRKQKTQKADDADAVVERRRWAPAPIDCRRLSPSSTYDWMIQKPSQTNTSQTTYSEFIINRIIKFKCIDMQINFNVINFFCRRNVFIKSRRWMDLWNVIQSF